MKNQENLFETNSAHQSLFESTVQWIQNLVKSGEYPVGAKLPPEKELCEAAGVSRTVMREALRAVEAKGLIAIYAGKGIFISEPDFDSIILPMELLINAGRIDVFDLTQARHFLEPGIAHVAAIRATEKDIRKLEDNLQDMIKNMSSGDEFIAADQRFHMNLALAAKNPVLYVMARAVVESLVVLRKTVYEAVGAPAKAVQRHQQIIDAIKVRHASEAYQVMESHILDVEEYQHIQLMKDSLEYSTFPISD